MIIINPNNIKYTKGQQQVLDEACTWEKNVLVLGLPGTGKTTIIEGLLKAATAARKRTLVCATTWAAADLLQGKTVHSVFLLPTDVFRDYLKNPTRRGRLARNMAENDVIIIDEISMLCKRNFSRVATVIKAANELRKAWGMKPVCLILFGDFNQLGPVITKADKERYAKLGESADEQWTFNAPEWEDFSFTKLYLYECVRNRDKTQFELITRLAFGDKSAEVVSEINRLCSHDIDPEGLYVFARNADVLDMNRKVLTERFPDSPSLFFSAVRENIKRDKRPPQFSSDELEIKIGARVLALSRIEDRVSNGSFGTVLRVQNDGIVVDFDNEGTCLVRRNHWNLFRDGNCEIWEPAYLSERIYSDENDIGVKLGSYYQYPLALAYATTVHRVQGKTIKSINADPGTFCNGQLYTMLSRVTDLKHIHLLRPLDPGDVKCSEEVKKFYKEEMEVDLDRLRQMNEEPDAETEAFTENGGDNMERNLITYLENKEAVESILKRDMAFRYDKPTEKTGEPSELDYFKEYIAYRLLEGRADVKAVADFLEVSPERVKRISEKMPIMQNTVDVLKNEFHLSSETAKRVLYTGGIRNIVTAVAYVKNVNAEEIASALYEVGAVEKANGGSVEVTAD